MIKIEHKRYNNRAEPIHDGLYTSASATTITQHRRCRGFAVVRLASHPWPLLPQQQQQPPQLASNNSVFQEKHSLPAHHPHDVLYTPEFFNEVQRFFLKKKSCCLLLVALPQAACRFGSTLIIVVLWNTLKNTFNFHSSVGSFPSSCRPRAEMLYGSLTPAQTAK